MRRRKEARLEFLILGPLEARRDGQPLPLGGPKQRGVLAILLTRANEVVPADRLIDGLWGGEPPAGAAGTLQGYISQLRKSLGADVLVTRAPGYVVKVAPGKLDLHRFERLLERGTDELATGQVQAASRTLREALALWRGPALADFAYELYAQAEIGRLEELRVAALERRIDADLVLGRHAELVGELKGLIASYPLRERLRAQLMLALYRSGRQAEALDAYRSARQALVNELGIEPSHALQELERAMLRQDPGLTQASGAAPRPEVAGTTPLAHPERGILVAPRDPARVDELVWLAERLSRRPPREVIIALLVGDERELAPAATLAEEERSRLQGSGTAARSVAFTTADWAHDAITLASEQEVDLLLLDVPQALLDTGTPTATLAAVLERMPCDVGLLAGRETISPAGIGATHPVLVPFGGDEHEWAAVEIAAWLASVQGSSLRLLGTAASPKRGRRDASRLLGRAALLVQKVTGVATEPVLVQPGEAAVLDAADDAGLVALGLSSRWRSDGLGTVRLTVLKHARPPVLLVRGGLRPGGLAPATSLTHFTWTLASPAST